MTITDWPLNERPREKLLSFGAKNLSDAELLAIFVNTGVRGRTAVDIARELLISFGGLKKLLQSWRIPPWQRDRIPLLYEKDQLKAIIGFAICQ